VDAVLAAYGRVDCLVNAAGLTARGTLLDTTPELFDAHIAVNLRGPFFLMQAVVRSLVERGAPGSIVNVISSSELGGQPYLAPYVAAKAGLPGSPATPRTHTGSTGSGSTASTIGWTDTEGEGRDPAGSSTAPTTAGGSGPRERCRWAGSVGWTRSPSSSCSCSPTRSGVVTGSVLDWDQIVFGAHD
jgi:NAD(P)-dependent dehydrogenase (short-subunit alcohol dehydrogenase family)